MNIVIDIRCLLEKNYSGVPSYAYNLLLSLFEIDSENQYFLFYNKFGYGKTRKNAEELVVKKFPNIKNLLNNKSVQLVGFCWPNRLLNFCLRFFGYPKLDKLVEKKVGNPPSHKATAGKIDVWFSPNPGFVNLSNDCRFVLTIHDLSFERYPEFFAGLGNLGIDYIRGRLWHKYVGVKKLCERANKIIVVSEATKRDLMDIYRIDENKIEMIHEGGFFTKITNHKFQACPEPSRRITNKLVLSEVEVSQITNSKNIIEKYNLPEIYILFLGTLEPRKNIGSIIKAFEKLITNYKPQTTNHNLVIAGVKGWLYQDLFKLAEKSSIKDKIKFIGYVDEEDKPALYKLASLFVFPSFYEGFGLPPLEAMSCGCPVIASNVSSLPEVVGDAGILVDPYNINELAEAMRVVLGDDELRGQLVEKGLTRSRGFSWERAAVESLEMIV